MMEEWRAVPGLERYKVSSLGRLIGPRGRMLTPVKPGSEKKYYAINTWEKGRRKQRCVHALVAAAFLGPCPEGHEICHGPGGRFDNSISNLSYGTKSQNNGIDKLRDGTAQLGSKNKLSKLKAEDVVDIRVNPEGLSYSQLAARYNVSKQCIYRIVHRLSWSWL